MIYSIKVSSLTNAQRGVKYLKYQGYKPSVTRIKNPLPADGCGYAIKVECNKVKELTDFLKEQGIGVTGVEGYDIS